MKEPVKPKPKRESGQSLVELAISLIVILFLLLGAVEFSIALFQYVTIRDAAQEGALYGSINPEEENNMKARAADAASDVVLLSPGDITVEINNKTVSAAISANEACEGLTNSIPNAVTVTITYNHIISFPLVGPMIGSNTIPLTASVTDTILFPSCDP
ncbi:MAG: pilus assembly protein [Anaerolineaceae bacterium]|jgi:Flp pilus assembly protein TadG|nr:MAG: pilus assembly protein [Anaerolineaceae bacterium]